MLFSHHLFLSLLLGICQERLTTTHSLIQRIRPLPILIHKVFYFKLLNVLMKVSIERTVLVLNVVGAEAGVGVGVVAERSHGPDQGHGRGRGQKIHKWRNVTVRQFIAIFSC